ncbi:hypothetical protein BgiBS90_018591, partial [Biomphalaria glabrata]
FLIKNEISRVYDLSDPNSQCDCNTSECLWYPPRIPRLLEQSRTVYRVLGKNGLFIDLFSVLNCMREATRASCKSDEDAERANLNAEKAELEQKFNIYCSWRSLR